MPAIKSFHCSENIVETILPLENGREINLYKYTDYQLTGIDLYYPNVLLDPAEGPLILPVLEKTMSLGVSTIYESEPYRMSFEPSHSENLAIESTPVFFFIYNTDNYFHFLYDTLPYLITFFKTRTKIPDLKLLMQWPNPQKHEFYPFVVEFLEILGIDPACDIIMATPNVVYDTIYISTSYTHDLDSNLPPRPEIYGFYRDMVAKVRAMAGPSVPTTPQKIYISRRTWLHNNQDNFASFDSLIPQNTVGQSMKSSYGLRNIGTNYTTRRKMVNETELVENLVSSGFVEVFTENLSTIEKILMFSGATHVVGAIGGGISNVLFSPKTTKLEAIVSPHFLDINKRFRYSLDCVDVMYNHNTEHIETGPYKQYMRVRTKDSQILGEITEVNDDNTIIVSYMPGFSTGWNAQMKYETIQLKTTDVIPIDPGLNSPWKLIMPGDTFPHPNSSKT